MSSKILVVDDFNLRKEGYQVVCAKDGEMAIKVFEQENPDLILLDIMMPKIDGYGVCRRIRDKSDIPIIMLTARADEIDKVLGLEIGADDYVTKPFGNRELMARVKANLRRKATVREEEKQVVENVGNVSNFGDLMIDFDRYEVFKRNQIFTREVLLSQVWGYEYYGDVRAVDVTIRRLREKIEDDASKPKHILTKRGIGYYFMS